jgi:hypothetical protein
LFWELDSVVRALRRVVIRILLWERADDGLVYSSSTVRSNPCLDGKLHGGEMQGGSSHWDELGEEKDDGGCERFSLFATSRAEECEVAIVLPAVERRLSGGCMC